MTHRQCRMLLLLGMLQPIGLILWYDTEQTVDLQFGREINQEGLTGHWEATHVQAEYEKIDGKYETDNWVKVDATRQRQVDEMGKLDEQIAEH